MNERKLGRKISGRKGVRGCSVWARRKHEATLAADRSDRDFFAPLRDTVVLPPPLMKGRRHMPGTDAK